MKIVFVSVFFPPLSPSRYPQRVSEQSKKKSLLIKTRVFPSFFRVRLLFWSGLLDSFFFLKKRWRVFFYLRSLASLRLKAPFLIDCVFDPETG